MSILMDFRAPLFGGWGRVGGATCGRTKGTSGTKLENAAAPGKAPPLISPKLRNHENVKFRCSPIVDQNIQLDPLWSPLGFLSSPFGTPHAKRRAWLDAVSNLEPAKNWAFGVVVVVVVVLVD